MNDVGIKKEMNKRQRRAAVLAFMLPFIPVTGATIFLMSCSNPTGGETTTPVTTVDKTLLLGTTPITIEYQSNVSVAQADLNKIQDRLDYLNGSVNPTDETIISSIKARNNIKIIIENVPDYSDGNNYRIIDGHTFAIRSEWLSSTTVGPVYTVLCAGFNGILAEVVSKIHGFDNVKLAKQLDTAKETV